MARYTDRWRLSILGPGESLQSEGYKFTDSDRQLIDRVLKWAAEEHRHTGSTGEDRTPSAGLGLSLRNTGGSMGAGHRYYYRYTVVDVDGNESGPSPIQSVDTALAISAPQAPAPSAVTGTGDLRPGTYSYVFSAYKDVDTAETKAVNSAAIKIPGTNPNNSVSIILPDLPLGATGLNVYRKSPSGMHYLYLTSIVPGGATPILTWVDDGTINGDCDRSLPPINRTSTNSSVAITYPGATPTVPDGWAWRIYRSESPTDWGRSFLAEIGPQGATPTTPVMYLDIGTGTLIGGPPQQAQIINAPPKINLADAAEVQGHLPPGRLVAPHVVTFFEPGPVSAATGTFTWVCDFEQADIISVRAYLGRETVPAVDDVVIDVNAYRQSTSSWDSIYSDGPGRPTVPTGASVGDPAQPTIRHLVEGDMLTVDVDQSGGGATPTDADLAVNVLMYVKRGSETTSYTWSA